jgi:hypothetical protein
MSRKTDTVIARTTPGAITELGRLAVQAKSEAARIAAIRELLDRAYGKPTQYLATDHEAVRSDKSEEELEAEMLASFGEIFPEYEIVPKAGSETVPRKRLTVIAGTNETS